MNHKTLFNNFFFYFFVTEPSKPLNLTVIRATSTTIELSWVKPEHENGDIKGYRIYFMHGNYTDVRTTPTPVLSYTLETLSKLKNYCGL